MKKLDKDNSNMLPFIAMAEDKTSREVSIVDDKFMVLHLFMVTHIPKYSKNEQAHTTFVLAPDESNAICQSECSVIGPYGSDARDEYNQRPTFDVSACRVPFLIRGWGSRKF